MHVTREHPAASMPTKHTQASTLTHVSDSLAGESLVESCASKSHPSNSQSFKSHASNSHASASKMGLLDAGVRPSSNEEIERDLHVVEFVVGALFTEKKRQLMLAIKKEFSAMPPEKRSKIECRCGCEAQAAPCKMHTELKNRELQAIAHRHWPALEKQLVKDLARSLCNTQRSQRWFSDELSRLSLENQMLRSRLAVVASAF